MLKENSKMRKIVENEHFGENSKPNRNKKTKQNQHAAEIEENNGKITISKKKPISMKKLNFPKNLKKIRKIWKLNILRNSKIITKQ